MNKEREVLKILFERYLNLLNSISSEIWEGVPEECSIEKLSKLAQEAIENGSLYPTDKLHRWLGFIQGVLVMRKIITVAEEREFTRPLLHSYLEKSPPTFST